MNGGWVSFTVYNSILGILPKYFSLIDYLDMQKVDNTSHKESSRKKTYFGIQKLPFDNYLFFFILKEKVFFFKENNSINY